MRVYALGTHATYGCANRGACCRAGWDIPVEPVLVPLIRAAVAAGRLPSEPVPLVTEPPLPPGAGAVLARTPDGACAFHDARAHRCLVQVSEGEAALPSSCRHFPRVVLRDGRGVFVVLSHFCPTAADLLWRDDLPLAIIESPRAFPAGDGLEGLDATDTLPPLLHPRMLLDLPAYAAWESHVIRAFGADEAPSAVLRALSAHVEVLRRWEPGHGPFAAALETLPSWPRASGAAGPAGAEDAAPTEALSAASMLARYEEVRAAIPEDLRPPAPSWRPGSRELLERPAHRRAVNRFLAAHAFANWCAYQGQGLRTILRGLEAVLAVLCVETGRLLGEVRHDDLSDRGARRLVTEAIRVTDLRLVHQADAVVLARRWSRAER
ncbi:MAG: hypothetical protein AB7G23_08340 [Vicinamibacterales bacterium]